MEMIHGDFKIGENCRASGVYSCENCRRAGRDSTVQLEKGAVFPFCAVCKERGAEEMDVLWRLSAKQRGRPDGRSSSPSKSAG